jgi:trigger factor
VGAEQVDAELEALRRQHCAYKAKEGAVATEDDTLLLDVAVTDDKGHPIEELKRENWAVVNVAQHLPEDVAKALIGKKSGEVVTAVIPNQRKGRRGAAFSENDHYQVTIKEIREMELPELDDEFARDLGDFEGLDALKKDILERLEKVETARQREVAFEAVCDQLIERNPFEAPRSLVVESQGRLLQQELYRRMITGQMNRRPTDEEREAMLAPLAGEAERQTRQAILLGEISRLEKITTTDEDLDKEIERMAETEGRRALALRAQLEAQRRLDDVRSNLQSRKVVDFLLEKAEITRKPAAATA